MLIDTTKKFDGSLAAVVTAAWDYTASFYLVYIMPIALYNFCSMPIVAKDNRVNV